MHNLARWYERDRWTYLSDRQTADAYAKWLGTIPWKLFCTLTFVWRVSDQQAIDVFSRFINLLERQYKSDVGYIRGDEKRFSGCGKPACGRHFHALLASAAPIAPEMVESVWTTLAGHRNDGSAALVLPYDPNQNGASYVLKFINQPEGDWAHHKLHLFHPEARGLQNMNRRTRRLLKRHSAREQYFANVESPSGLPSGRFIATAAQPKQRSPADTA